jgi:hypothetical protein
MLNKLFKSKQARRAKLANLPIEEKYKILLDLQRIASSICLSRGIKKRPWIPAKVQIMQVDESNSAYRGEEASNASHQTINILTGTEDSNLEDLTRNYTTANYGIEDINISNWKGF